MFWCVLAYVWTACTKPVEYVEPQGYPKTPEGVFEAFWNGIDQNYVFFPSHNLNWDDVYSTYRPMVNGNTSSEQLAVILSKMFDLLIDGHRRLEITGITTLTGLPANYTDKYAVYDPYPKVEAYYFDTYELDGDTLYNASVIADQAGSTDGVAALLKGGQVAYLRIFGFGPAWIHEKGLESLDRSLTFFQNNTQGLILDLRFNFGGDARAFYNVVSRFISQKYTWGYLQTRINRDRYDLSLPIPQQIESSGTAFTKPIVVLCDRYSFSAAELTTMALKQLPNVTVLGDTTAGVTGPISEQKDYTGNFVLPNGWRVTLAQRVVSDNSGRVYEAKGIAPHKAVGLDDTDRASKSDKQLEKAIEILSSTQP